MDNDALKLIARLKIAAARRGQPIDVVRFAADRAYARAALQKFADAASDEEGVLLALQLMDKLGMTAVQKAEPVAAAASTPPARPATLTATDERYIGRLR